MSSIVMLKPFSVESPQTPFGHVFDAYSFNRTNLLRIGGLGPRRDLLLFDEPFD